MRFHVDLSLNSLTCIVGKNGVGKTTLIKSLQTLRFADTFTQTSQPGIFKDDSLIKYTIDGLEYRFSYDSDIRSLNSKDIIPNAIKENIDVELPMPYGQRFSFFQTLTKADSEIRSNIVLEDYERPAELIDFLNSIYSTEKFNTLIKLKIKKNEYYCILLEDSRYIREDYLSSGEYLLISVYRKIKTQCKFIVIDEIDISLDAAAQTRLAEKLREFCQIYQVNILFTTHSLALMKTLRNDEIFYLLENNGVIAPTPASYNYIKSILFGFKGWDRYILTEDELLQNLIQYLINKHLPETHFQYKIIYIGGGSSVVDLMRRNSKEEFFSQKTNVISVLDGDQAKEKHAQNFKNVYCIPFDSVEKQIHNDYHNGSLQLLNTFGRIPGMENKQLNKQFYQYVRKQKLISEIEVFDYLCETYKKETQHFCNILRAFLFLPDV